MMDQPQTGRFATNSNASTPNSTRPVTPTSLANRVQLPQPTRCILVIGEGVSSVVMDSASNHNGNGGNAFGGVRQQVQAMDTGTSPVTQLEHWRGARPHLDRLTALGCCGQVYVETGNAGFEDTPAIDQLLRIRTGTTNIDLPSSMRVRVHSTEPAELCKRYGHIMQRSSRQLDIAEEPLSMTAADADLDDAIILGALADEAANVDVLVLHLRCADDTTNASSQLIHTMDRIARIFSESPFVKTDLFVAIATPLSFEDSALLSIFSPSSSSSTGIRKCPFEPPRQSYTLASYHHVPTRAIPMTIMYCHPHAVRRDQCTEFTERDCSMHGCNGGIRARHVLAEVGYMLGRMPKYGA